MKKKLKLLLAMLLCIAITSGCSDVTMQEKTAELSVEDAKKELDALLTRVNVTEVENPKLDIYTDDISENAALADIDTFDIVVKGNGAINIEVAAATELTSESPDDWITVVAKNFNREDHKLNDKKVTITVRQITSGEIMTYVNAGIYQPNAAIFSNDAWGKMVETAGIKTTQVCDRIAGNTAGILISKEAEVKVKEAYKEVNFDTVIKAAQDGLIVFGYSNPYTSSTGLNGLTTMLKVFDPSNPLSDKASNALLEYQKLSPPVAYTTAVLRNQAKKGIIDAMVMEEQAYVHTPELSSYSYIPFGIRHDHPVYSFDWNTADENKAVQMFVDYCLTPQNQKLATDKGFNRHDDYKSQDTGLTGQGYLTAQSMWKENKSGGRPVIAVFICDISGSMRGEPLASLQQSLIATLPYIGSEHYVGLISYSDDVTINLGIKQFDDKQRAYFSGEVKNLTIGGSTHTYDAVLEGLSLINEAQAKIPDAVPLLILLTDGETTGGYTLSRITPVTEGMRVPVYCISYNYESGKDLETLSGINEASTIKANSEDIVNQLRNLFTTQL